MFFSKKAESQNIENICVTSFNCLTQISFKNNLSEKLFSEHLGDPCQNQGQLEYERNFKTLVTFDT